MNKKLKKAVRDQFRFPEARRKTEFLMQAEVISANKQQRKGRSPVIFGFSAAAAAAALTLGILASPDRPQLSENDFRDGPATVTTTTAEVSQTVTTADRNGISGNASGGGTASAHSNTAKTTTTARAASPAQEAASQRTTVSRSEQSSASSTGTGSHGFTDEETTYYMQKLGAYASSFVTSGTIPMSETAQYTVPASRMYSGEDSIFEDMEANMAALDINGDGVFNIRDCYDVFCYSSYFQVSGAVTDNCRYYGVSRTGDAEDTTPSWLSYRELLRYIIIKEGAGAELFSPEMYPERGSYLVYGSSTDSFLNVVFEESSRLMAGYPLVSAAYRSGRLDFDVNGDGSFDIYDYIDFFVCSSDLNRTDGRVWERPASTTERCTALRQQAQELTRDGWIDNYFVWCLLEYTPFTAEYADAAFYSSIIPSQYADSYSPERYFEEYCAAAGIKEYLFSFDTERFNRCFEDYCKDVAAGRRSAPDINLDGVIDRRDYEDSDTYFGDILNGRDASHSRLPDMVWSNIASNCDFSGNGTSGDVYDIMITQMYVLVNSPQGFGSDSSYNYGSSMGMLADIIHSGDVNGDGEIDMADAVLIIQYLADPIKYPLTDEALFNADVHGSCNGVDLSDAAAIQRSLLELMEEEHHGSPLHIQVKK